MSRVLINCEILLSLYYQTRNETYYSCSAECQDRLALRRLAHRPLPAIPSAHVVPQGLYSLTVNCCCVAKKCKLMTQVKVGLSLLRHLVGKTKRDQRPRERKSWNE